MSTGLADFLFETVNFLLLAAVLGYVFFRPVRRALDREREQRAQEEERGRQLLAEADEARRAAQSERDGLEAELDARRDATLTELKQETDEGRRRARAAEATERDAHAEVRTRLGALPAVDLAPALRAAAPSRRSPTGWPKSSA